MIMTLDNISDVSEWIIRQLTSPCVVFFFGEVGVGKTTLIKNICKTLGIHNGVRSPSYTYVNEYRNDNIAVAHIDLYRGGILDVDELTQHDHFDYVFVEWPKTDSPVADVSVSIELLQDNTRKVTLKK